jgi:hypothetical protein
MVLLMSLTAIAEAAPLGVNDANGNYLGTFASADDKDEATVLLVTPRGYLAKIEISGWYDVWKPGYPRSILGLSHYWQSADCSGSRLAYNRVAGRIESDGSAIYYVPVDAVPVTIVAGQSYSYDNNDSTGCHQATMETDSTFMPTLPNDPNVTGISNGPFALPLRLSFVDPIYRNGFESPA